MKQLTELSATASEAEWREPRGVIQTIHDEPVKGFFRRITLGAAGLVIRCKAGEVGIPLDALLKLAEQHEPKLRPPTLAETPTGNDQPAT